MQYFRNINMRILPGFQTFCNPFYRINTFQERIDNFDAIINPPHAAILAVGAGAKKPVVGEDGEVKVATVMSTTLSVDHRVIDGALGANLLNAIKANLENPMGMLA